MAFDDKPEKLEGVFVQRGDVGKEFYEQINISGSDLIVYFNSEGKIDADKIWEFARKYNLGGSGISSVSVSASYAITASDAQTGFDGNRSIKRTPYAGLNVGGTTLKQFVENFFFPFIPATISINSSGTTYYESGSGNLISINGTVTANDETIFSSGSVRRDGADWYTFSSASSYSTSETVTGSLGITSRTYRTYMGVNNNGTPALISSSIRTLSFIYPYLSATSSVAGLSGNTLYTSTNKTIQPQGTRTTSFFGTAKYIYFCYPDTYTDLNSIKDQNGFEVISLFDFSASVPITSSGLASNWAANYKVYRSKLLANPSGSYIFSHS